MGTDHIVQPDALQSHEERNVGEGRFVFAMLQRGQVIEEMEDEVLDIAFRCGRLVVEFRFLWMDEIITSENFVRQR